MGFERRVARRDFLRLSGGALLGTTVSALFGTPRTAHAEPLALRETWHLTEASLAVVPLVSPPLRCDFPFNALETRWEATTPPGSALTFAVRTSADGVQWGEWHPVFADNHARDDEATDGPTYGDLHIVGNATHAQYRIDATGLRGAPPTLRGFALTAVSTRIAGALGGGDGGVRAQAFDGKNLIPRSGWNADEKLRYKEDEKAKKREEIWTPEFRPVQKIIVHHTVTRDPEPDPKATIRAIYQFHAVQRGWGDLGYNILIDQQGTVYEGRHGGRGVVAGHTLGYNYGSVGVAVLGNYKDRDMSKAARSALLAFVKAHAPDLDPVGKGFFVNKECPNISGHRGFVNSTCPGDAFYPTMNNLRRELKGLPAWTGDPAKDPVAANPPDVIVKEGETGGVGGTTTGGTGTANPHAEIAAVAWSATSVYSRDLVTARVTLKNTGNTRFGVQDPPASTVYEEGETYATRRFAPLKGTLRVAIGPDERGTDLPFRWGVGRTLGPGESIVVPVAFRFTRAQKARYAVSLIYEGYGLLDAFDTTPFTVYVNPADAAEPLNEPGAVYFRETKHSLAPEFRDYWNANGGLFQFGYPITEAFMDTNPEDFRTYRVQYFERARFESHPEQNDTRFRVQLGRLGVALTAGRNSDRPFIRTPQVADAPERRYFPETGHTLSDAFKGFWDRSGGVAIYGLPLCEPFEERSVTDGKLYTVQYFERNRFELHPEYAGTPQEVQLGLLGSETLRRRGWID